MKETEIVDAVIELLREHASEIHQDPYKHDFFRLFAAAYNAGMIHGGGQSFLRLNALIFARAPQLAAGSAWDNLYQFWSEWTYAWDHVSELRAS